MKRTGILILLLFICGALLLTYFIVLNKSSANQSETTSETDAETLAPVEQIDQTTISKIEYTRNGETLGFVYDVKNAVWNLATDDKCPLNQELINAMATALSAVEITNKLDNSSDTGTSELGSEQYDPSEYGLDTPSTVISRTDSYGNTKVFSLGNYNNYNQSYYMSVSGDSSVYMTSSAFKANFDYGLYGLVVSETSAAIPSDKITSIDISRGDVSVNTTDTNAIATAASIALSDCIDYYADDNELTEYGFDSQVKIVINYNDEKAISQSGNSYSSSTAVKVPKIFEYYIGNASGEDSFYIMMQDSRMVFKISKTTADTIIAFLDSEKIDAGDAETYPETNTAETEITETDETESEVS